MPIPAHLPIPLALIGPIGTTELIVIAVVGLLIFGKRLPEVGKSIGQGLLEFKRGLAGIETDLQQVNKPPEQIEQKPAEPTEQALAALPQRSELRERRMRRRRERQARQLTNSG